VSDFRRKLFTRIVVFQSGRVPKNDYLVETGTGSILDLTSRHILSNTVLDASEERVKVA